MRAFIKRSKKSSIYCVAQQPLMLKAAVSEPNIEWKNLNLLNLILKKFTAVMQVHNSFGSEIR
jgi:hypothetical protein